MVIAGIDVGHLCLLCSERRAGGRRIVELPHVARLDALELGFQIDAVLERDLLFDPGGDIQSINVVVRPPAVVQQIIRVQGIAGIAERAKLRAGLTPVARTEIVGSGKYSQSVPLEQIRVFLLRDVLGQGTAADGREQVRDQ